MKANSGARGSKEPPRLIMWSCIDELQSAGFSWLQHTGKALFEMGHLQLCYFELCLQKNTVRSWLPVLLYVILWGNRVLQMQLVKSRTLLESGGPLIQYDWCPYKKTMKKWENTTWKQAEVGCMKLETTLEKPIHRVCMPVQCQVKIALGHHRLSFNEKGIKEML